ERARIERAVHVDQQHRGRWAELQSATGKGDFTGERFGKKIEPVTCRESAYDAHVITHGAELVGQSRGRAGIGGSRSCSRELAAVAYAKGRSSDFEADSHPFRSGRRKSINQGFLAAGEVCRSTSAAGGARYQHCVFNLSGGEFPRPGDASFNDAVAIEPDCALFADPFLDVPGQCRPSGNGKACGLEQGTRLEKRQTDHARMAAPDPGDQALSAALNGVPAGLTPPFAAGEIGADFFLGQIL